MTDPKSGAIAAARRAKRQYEDMPNIVLAGQSIAECPDCGERFDYGKPGQPVGFDSCPSCGSHEWYKWGYRYNGEEYRRDEARDEYDAPPGAGGDDDAK